MRAVVVGGLLLASNLVWFGILQTIRRHGYPVSILNSVQDLRSYRSLILKTGPQTSRFFLSVGLAALYVFLLSLALIVAL